MDTPDKFLLERFRTGDEKAFRELYEGFKAPVMKFCIAMIKDAQEAENMYQEVFLKIWKRRDAINPDLNFSSYLFTAVKNQVLDHLRQVKKDQQLKKAFLLHMAQRREEAREEKEEKLRQLEGLVQALTPQRRTIVALTYSLGKSYAEIATHLLISKNTVKNHLVQIKLILRKGIG